jgi:hypothetical protein
MTYAAPINAIDNIALAAERWYQFSEVATAKTEATYHWYVNTFIGPEAVRRYEDIGTIIGVVMCYAIGAGMLTRAAWEWFIAAQQLPAVALEDDLPSLPERLEVAAEMTGAEVVQAEIEAAFLEEMIAAIEETEQPAAPVKAMTETQRLRKECTAKGIRWRNVRGKGKHMTLPAMKAALETQASAQVS